MVLHDAKAIAESLMKQHGLSGWSFRWDNAKKRMGLCDYRNKAISLSHPLVTLNEEDRIKNTILHEIAHALAGPEAGHGRSWKHKAIQIGCDGHRCFSESVVRPPAPYVLKCSNCGVETPRHKNTNKRCACFSCCNKYNRGRFSSDYLLTLHKKL
jgi:predicted SprT family Zn-dependent metalloprotease